MRTCDIQFTSRKSSRTLILEPLIEMFNSEQPREWRVTRNLSLDNVIGQVQKGVSTRRSLNHFCEHMAFVSQVEPKIVTEALEDNNWINAMHEELNQFARNEVWTPVPRSKKMNVIRTKWAFKNKESLSGIKLDWLQRATTKKRE